MASAWTPERKREYARERYRRLKAQKLQKNRDEAQEAKPENFAAKEELRRMAKWFWLEAKKS